MILANDVFLCSFIRFWMTIYLLIILRICLGTGQNSCISCILQPLILDIEVAKVNGHTRKRDDKRQQKSRQYQDCLLLSAPMSLHVCAFFPKTDRFL